MIVPNPEEIAKIFNQTATVDKHGDAEWQSAFIQALSPRGLTALEIIVASTWWVHDLPVIAEIMAMVDVYSDTGGIPEGDRPRIEVVAIPYDSGNPTLN